MSANSQVRRDLVLAMPWFQFMTMYVVWDQTDPKSDRWPIA